MLVYAVRHAESLANTGQANGLNTTLSMLGERQAAALGRRFASTPITAIYSSPFERSIQTALPIAKAANVPVRIRPELSEYHHLSPGTSVNTELERIGDVVCRNMGVIPCPDFQGLFSWPAADESSEAMIARMCALAAFVKDRWRDPEDTVVLVSHGSPIARLVEALLTDQPGPWFRFTIDNGAVSAIRYYENVSSLVCLNEISHLRELPMSSRANFRNDGSIKPVPPNGFW